MGTTAADWSNVLTRQQSEVAGKGHATREGAHHQVLGLEVQVLQHFVRAPMAN
jgi:hypothetical protein